MPDPDLSLGEKPFDPATFEPVDLFTGEPEIEQRFANVTAPISPDVMMRVIERPPPAPVTEAEAASLWQKYPYMTEDERFDADTRFSTYRSQLVEEEDKKWREERRNMLLNPEEKKAFYLQPEVIEFGNRLEDPNALWAKQAVTKVLEKEYLGRPLVPGEYEIAKNQFIGREEMGQPKVSDTEALSFLTKREEQNVELETMGEEASTEIMNQRAASLQPGAKPFRLGEVFDKLRSSHRDLFKGRESQIYGWLSEMNEGTIEFFNRNKEPLIKATEFFMKPSVTTDDQLAVADAFLRTDPKEVDMVLQVAVNAVNSGAIDKGELKRRVNSLQHMAGNILGFSYMWTDVQSSGLSLDIAAKRTALRNGTARIDPTTGQIYYESQTMGLEGLRPLTPEETRIYQAETQRQSQIIGLNRQISHAWRKTQEPTESMFFKGTAPGWLERGIVSFNDSLAGTVVSASPIGKILYTMGIGSQYMEDLLAENPGMDERVAATAGYSSALVESFLEGIEFKWLRGATPNWMLTTLRSGKAATFIKQWLGINLGEAGVEGIQDLSTAIITKMTQEVAHAIDPNMDVGKIDNWQQLIYKWGGQRWETQGQIFWAAFIGSGVGTYRHMKDPARQLYNQATLKGFQFTDAEINDLLTTKDPSERDAKFANYFNNRTPEQIADYVIYQQGQVDQANTATTPTAERPLATLATETRQDGTRVWHVVDENGNRIMENLPADVALSELATYQQILDMETLQKQAEQATTEEQVQRTAAAETVWEALKPEDKTTAANILEFEYATPQTPAQQRAHTALQQAVAARNARLGTKDNVSLVSIDVPATRAGVGAVNFIRWFEKTFGKSVQFVASTDGQRLSFGGLVVEGEPNTIFLDASGDRNILALLGHEWSHTLEKTNPKLWADTVAQMKPLIVDWAKATGMIDPSYDASQATPEFVANVMGDAFADPEFWKTVRAQNASLFERMLQAIQDWFDTVMDHVSEYGTQSPEIIRDLAGMRNLIANVLKEAQKGPEGVPATPVSTVGAQSALPRAFSKYVSEGVREKGRIASERERKLEEANIANEGRMLAAQDSFRRAKAAIYGGGLGQDYGAGQEGPGQLGRYVRIFGQDIDVRLVRDYGYYTQYDAQGFPVLWEPLDTPPELLGETKEKQTAVIDKELAKELGIKAGTITRQELRDAIVAHFIKMGDKSLGKKAFLSGGGGGSGKSTLMAQKEGMDKAGRKGYVHIDADEIRKLIPEYRALIKLADPRAAEFSHEESSDLTKRIFNEALEAELPILYDATLSDSAKAKTKIIDPLKSKQYKIRMMGVIIDPREGITRAYERAARSKRFVPVKTLYEAHTGFLNAVANNEYQALLGTENVHIYDNSKMIDRKDRPLPETAEEMKPPSTGLSEAEVEKLLRDSGYYDEAELAEIKLKEAGYYSPEEMTEKLLQEAGYYEDVTEVQPSRRELTAEEGEKLLREAGYYSPEELGEKLLRESGYYSPKELGEILLRESGYYSESELGEILLREAGYFEGEEGEPPAPNTEAAFEGQASVPRSYGKMTGAPPKKTVKAFKLFRQKPDGLHPLFIDKRAVIPTGVWMSAKNIPTKGTQFAKRPGWHAGVLPTAPHLRTKEGQIADNRVWAEVEMGNDVNWQGIADQSRTRDIRSKVPKGGTYKFKTNKMQGGAWQIGGEMRVTRVLTDNQVREILTEAGHPEDAAAESRSQPSTPRHKFATRGERETDANGGYITEDEKTLVHDTVSKWLAAKGVKGAEHRRMLAKAKEDIHADIMSTRSRNPDESTGAEDPWSPLEVSGAKVEFRTAKDGEARTLKAVGAWKKQNYRFDEIPEGMTREQWAQELSTRVLSQFTERLIKGYQEGASLRDREGAELIVQEIEWYRKFVQNLRQEFGGAADFMADLLGAFSPRQNVRLNFRNAVDAIWAISNGKYDQLLSDLDAYLKADPTHTIKTWRDAGGAVMTARSGALFGTNTERGMTAALGMWRAIKAGDKPKAKNFTRNLIALSYKATVDVWAARLLNRVAGKPRIPVDAEGAVAGAHLTEAQLKKQYGEERPAEIPVTGQFAFGQDVFERVAAQMRDPETWKDSGLPAEVVAKFATVTAADVQATNWFVEKEIWTENDWTNEEGSGGSFIGEIEALIGTRFQVGLAQAISDRPGTTDFNPQDADQLRFIGEVRNDLSRSLPEVISMRVMDSLGMYKDARERSTDLELTHGPGLEPNDLMRAILYHAWSKDQSSTHVSRVLEPWDDLSENARPGIEIYFKGEVGLHDLEPVMKLLGRSGINGFTAIVDPRAGVGAQRFIGVRFQYVPEYSGDGPAWTKNAQKVRRTLERAHRKILLLDGVASVRLQEYDTVVFQKGLDYDDAGVNPGALGTSEARAWRRRYFDSVSAKAVRRDAREVAVEQHELSHREQAIEERGPPGLAPPTVKITAFDPALMGFAEREVVPDRQLLRQMREEAKIYDQLLECLS